MGTMLRNRSLAGKIRGMVLAAALAGAFAIQSAPPGIADAETPSPSAGAETPPPSAGAEAQTVPAVVEPVPTSQPTGPAASLTPTQTVVVPAGPDQTPAADADPLAVQGYMDWGYVGKPFDAPLVITGGTGPYTATATNVPPGLTFDEANLRFVGTPTTAGFAESTVTVKDSSSPQQVVTQGVSVTIWDYQPPVISVASYTGEFPDAIVGLDYKSGFRVYTPGSLPYRLELVSGDLPPGLVLNEKTVSGVPTAPGSYAFTVRASDQYNSTEATFRITVRANAPYAVGYVVPPAVLGEPYSAKIASVTGGVGPYQLWWGTPQHMAGSLTWHDPGPDGLTIDGNGILHGTPTRAGTFTVYVKFRDAGLVEREIFWTTITVLETRPPAAAQPPATQPPAAGEAPPAAVLPARAVHSTSDAELAATGLRAESLHGILWTSAGLLATGTILAAATRRRRRRGKAA